ncbi:hypothetical protein GCM10010415_04720 [Streptomyces atrovirens]
MITALARAQGIQEARVATAKLDARPTPPPQSAKRAKAAKAPGAACCRPRLCAVSMIRPLPAHSANTRPSICEVEECAINGAMMAHKWCHAASD